MPKPIDVQGCPLTRVVPNTGVHRLNIVKLHSVFTLDNYKDAEVTAKPRTMYETYILYFKYKSLKSDCLSSGIWSRM